MNEQLDTQSESLKSILLKSGFKQNTNLDNEFKKSNYTAIIDNGKSVIITKYTPNTNRYLNDVRINTKDELLSYCKEHIWI